MFLLNEEQKNLWGLVNRFTIQNVPIKCSFFC